MRIYRAYSMILIVFMLSIQMVYAQQMLRGMVKDETGEPITAANVILKQHENTAIKAFSITNDKGEFSLKIPPDLDSLFVMITHLSYAKKAFYISVSQAYLEVVVAEQQYELPELVVKNDPIIRRGDTLIFNVDHYRNDADQNIEQVLSKIPGVTVESNGQILYDGLPISKFYIEGLDMLEGRYRIATRNLNVDAIRDIEVIEHHQPIRALDSLVRPDNAAINLRLKSNIALTGALRVGAGLSPGLYVGDGDVFGFTKKQQFSISASANNIGERQSDDFQNLYTGGVADFDLIQVNKIYLPASVKKEYYLDNQEWTGGYNYLRKIATYTEVKWQGAVRKDKIASLGNRNLRFNNGEDEVIFNESLNVLERPLSFDNRIIVEHNAKKVFFRADVTAEWDIHKSSADTKVNNAIFFEDLDNDDINILAELSAIIRQKNKAYRINSNIEYTTNNYDLTLSPADIFTPDFPATRFEKAFQMAQQTEFTTDTYSNLSFKIKDITGQVHLGVSSEHNTLDTDIFTADNTAEKTSLGAGFQNQNSVRKLTPYFNQSYKIQNNQSVLSLHLPLSTSWFYIHNELNDDQSSFNVLVIKPSINYRLDINSDKYWNIGYGLSYDYTNNADALFYEGYIIRYNRNLATSILDINRFLQQRVYTGIASKNIWQGSGYDVSVSLSQGTYDFLDNSSFNQQGVASGLTEGENTVRNFSLNGHVAGTIGNSGDFDIRTLYSLSNRQNIINGEMLSVQNQFITINSKINYTLKNSIFSLKPNFQFFANNFFDTPTYQANAELVYFIKLDRIGSLRASYNQYWTATGKMTVWNELLSLEYKYTLLKQKIDIVLNINNLTDNKNYVTFSQSTFSESLSYFRLRPRQIVCSFSKKF